MAAKSKSFRAQMNPVMQFISNPAPEAPAPIQHQESAEAAPEGFKANPGVETKSRRLQLLMQPSLHNKVKAAAKAKGYSVNEYIHHILEAATKGE